MKGKVTCSSCGWSWNKSDSSKKDMYICHECGRDNSNNMKNGGDIPKAQVGHFQTINPRQKRGIELLTEESKKAAEDKRELETTGQIKRPRSIAYKSKVKKQPELKQDNRTDYEKGYDERKAKLKKFNKVAVGAADVATDIMQVGNFIPHPAAQLVGKIGNVAGAAVDAYQAGMDLSEGNYGSAAFNLGSATLPSLIEGAGYTRSMYNTNPGSMADKIASLGNRSGNYIHLTPLSHAISPVTMRGINYNRALLGALSGETAYDITNPLVASSEPSLLPPSLLETPPPPVPPRISSDKTIQYYNTNPKNGEVEKPGESPNVKYVPVSNSQELKQWKKQKIQPLDLPESEGLVLFAKQLPKSDIPKQKNGGWLDNYGEEANANDGYSSAPDNWVGDGYSNVGRNYSPAWGGQFQMGGSVYPVNYVPQAQNGKLTFLQPTSDKLPQGYRIPYDTPSSERAMSIGGEDGEPAYLIPSFKYGQPLDDPMGEFRKTGEHLGGPFKTYQEADEWERTVRHPAVERKKTIMFPQEKFAMGGSIPGAVGFSYARTQSPAPSNGPYAKKTKASAENGGWLSKYDDAQNGYQTGDKITYGTPEYTEAYNKGEVVTEDGQRSPILLDEVTIQNDYKRPRGFWEQYADKIAEENKDAGLFGAIVGTPISAITSLPQLAATYGVTGEMQRPSEAMDIQNPYGAFAVDAIADPANLIGAGLVDDALNFSSKAKNLFKKGYKQLDFPKENLEPALGRYDHNPSVNKNLVYQLDEEGNAIPFNKETGKSLQDEYVQELKNYYDSDEFKRIMRDEYPDVDVELYKKHTLDNLKNKLTYSKEGVADDAIGTYYPSRSSSTVYVPGHTPTFKQKVNNANTLSPEMSSASGNKRKSFVIDMSATDHELSHQRTNTDELLPEYLTQDYLKQNIKPEFREEILNNPEHDFNTYYSKPTEFDVRIKQLKNDLKREGINDYFKAPMDEEHLSRLEQKHLRGLQELEAETEFKKFTNTYKEAKKNKVSQTKLDELKNNFYKKLEGVQSKYKFKNTSRDSEDLFKYFTPEFIAKEANKLPALLPVGLGIGAASQIEQQRQGGIINSDRGQWDHPGKVTRIKGGKITMKPDPKTGKPLTEPLLGIANTGERKMMYPGQDYQFQEGTEYVTEFPMAKNGIRQEQKGLVNLDQLTNFTNYNKPQPGGWLNKYN